MYTTIVAAAIAALPLLAASSPAGKFALKRQNNCSTGPIQCCNQVEAVRSDYVTPSGATFSLLSLTG